MITGNTSNETSVEVPTKRGFSLGGLFSSSSDGTTTGTVEAVDKTRKLRQQLPPLLTAPVQMYKWELALKIKSEKPQQHLVGVHFFLSKLKIQ